jgi:hypothetical protein
MTAIAKQIPDEPARTTTRLLSKPLPRSLNSPCARVLRFPLSKLFTIVHALAVQRDGVRSVFEIVLRVQIGNEPRLNRSPSQLSLRLHAGSRAVYSKEKSDPAKMIGCLLARLADNGYVQMPADDLGDLSSPYALVGDAVIRGSSRTFL